jgi:hypothetical protein
MKKALKPLFAGLTVIGLIGSCSRNEKMADISNIDFREGDIVFRRGRGVKSEAVLHVDTAGLYSHSGIVVKCDSAFMIIHITPDEREAGETEDRIKMEPPETFFAPDRAKFGSVYRLPDDTLNMAKTAAEQALRLWKRGVVFDHDYVLDDSTQMYCTELVWHVYRMAGKDITNNSRSEIVNVPLFSGVYILPSDIYSNKELVIVFSF